jgi:hypothetical protein
MWASNLTKTIKHILSMKQFDLYSHINHIIYTELFLQYIFAYYTPRKQSLGVYTCCKFDINVGKILKKLFPKMDISCRKNNGKRGTSYSGIYWKHDASEGNKSLIICLI